jgi:prepilin-type N-terminal cleavage/methylation domain-containing protein/prepilin-type processing-associated H-X9-DG protein
MKSSQPHRPADGFSLVELLVVIGIIALLAALLLPALSGGQKRARRIWCESNLRQLGIAFHSFAHDHNSKFPMQVPVGEGGSQEFAENSYLVNGNFYFGYRHFQALANLLETPKPLICPADTRTAATNFAALQNANISYFVGVDADYSKPMSLLAGDGNLSSPQTLLRTAAGSTLLWTATQHHFKGNVLFADGHVEEFSSTSGNRLTTAQNFSKPTINPTPTPATANPAEGSRPSFSPASAPPDAKNSGGGNSNPRANPAAAPPSAAPSPVIPAQNPPASPSTGLSPNTASATAQTPNTPTISLPKERLIMTPQPGEVVAVNPIKSQTFAQPTPGSAISNITNPPEQIMATAQTNIPETNAVTLPAVKTHSGFFTSWSWLWLALLLLIGWQIRRWLQNPKPKRNR